MANAYAPLDVLKSSGVANITGTGDDVSLRRLVEGVSRQWDRICRRHFYAQTLTREFRGNGTARMHLPADLIAVTTLKEDDNGDATFNISWVAADYILTPEENDPTGSVDLETTRPFWAIEVDTRTPGSRNIFANVQKRFQLAGKWGYSESKLDSGDTVQNNPLAAAATALNVVSGGNFDVLETLLIESEQLYITAIVANALTVQRGVNGTAAASHANATAINIIKYPAAIVEATLMQASRLLTRRSSGFANQVGFSETGQMSPVAGVDKDVWQMLRDYIRPPVVP